MKAYTSNSEFDLVKRVHVTNETPTYNLYQGVNSTLRNDLWAWFLGKQEVDWELPFGPLDSEYESTFFKSVNGTISEDFGPRPTEFNPTPEYHKLKLTGVLTPEYDLLLHETYRYLGSLYPDHPDFVEILTQNEINSMINSAAAMVDYSPNLKFLEKLAESYGLESSVFTEKEAMRLKIRNLLANAFRRKFYGSKLGYKMFGAGVLENVSIFPLGTYLPLQPELLINGQKQEIAPAAHRVNVRSSLYKNKFKLIDWDGSCGDRSTIEDENVYAKFYTVPGFDYNTFLLSEDQNDIEDFNNIEANDYFTANFFSNNDTVYVNKKLQSLVNAADYITLASLGNYATSTTELDFLALSKRVPTTFVDAFRLGSWEEFFGKLTSAEIAAIRATEGDGLDTFVAGTNSRALTLTNPNAAEFLFRIFNRLSNIDAKDGKISKFSCVGNPYYLGGLLAEPSVTLAMYPEAYSAKALISKSGVLEGYATPDAVVSGACQVKTGDIICTDDLSKPNDSQSLVKVNGINLGKLEFTANAVSSYAMDPILGYSCPTPSETSLYGAVLKSQDGETRLFVQGEMTLETKAQGLYTVPSKGTFTITAIPEALTDELFKLLYPVESSNLLSRLAEQQELLKIDSRRVEAEAEIATIQDEITFLKINKAKAFSIRDYVNSDEETVSYEAYNVFSGCFIEAFYKIIGDFTEMVNGDGRYFWHEMVTYYGALIDYIDYGSFSVLPIVSTGSVATNSMNAYFTEVKTETLTGQGFQYLDLADDYMTNSAEFKPNVKTPGYVTQATKKQLSYSRSGNNAVVSDVTTYDLQIEGTVISTDDERLTIKFSSDAALHDMQSLTVGDPLFGAGVQAGTYVVDIGDDFVTVSDKLLRDGDVLFTFTARFDCAGKDLEEEFDYYKDQLKANGLLKLANPFENGIWPSAGWPNVSSSYVDGLIDVSLFTVYEPTFYRTMKGTHETELAFNDDGSPKNYLIPSTIKFNNDLFAEINLKRLLPLKNRAGVSNTLCNVEFIDYLSTAIPEIARGTEVVSCGAQLSMQTDISGYYSQVTGQQYTDPAIKLFFQTFGCENGMPVPCYAQVGAKGDGRRNWFKSSDDNVSPEVYGGTFWDQQVDGIDTKYVDLVNNLGAYRKRSVWASKSEIQEKADDNSLDETKYVEKALFEIALGEYDTQYYYADASGESNKVHTIQCNFYRQKFENLNFIVEKASEEAIKLISNRFESLSIITEINKASVVVDTVDTGRPAGYELGIDTSTLPYLNDVVYCGTWEPSASKAKVNWPAIPEYNGLDSTLYYMVVEKGKTLTYDNEAKSIEFADNSILVLSKNASGAFWKPVSFVLGGSNYPTAILSETIQAKDSFDIMCDNIARNYFVDTSAKVSLSSVEDFRDNFFARSQDITNNLDDSKCYVYVCLFDGFDVTGNTPYDTTCSTVFSAGSYVGVIYEPWLEALRFFKLNINTRTVAALQFDMPPKMSVTEFKYLTGAFTKFSGTNLRSKVTNSVASIKLPKPFLTNGSVDIKAVIDGGFISKGYRAQPSGGVDTSSIVFFNISNSAIFYDEDLEYFYVNSFEHNLQNGEYIQTSTEEEKFYIYFSDPTYFKNTLRNYGTYRVKKSQTSGSAAIDYTPVVTQIAGFTSLYDKLSNEDQILEVKEVVTRSFYNALYNSIGFDFHTSVNAEVAAVNEGINELILAPASSGLADCVAMNTKVTNLWPAKVVDGVAVKDVETRVTIKDGGAITEEVLTRSFGPTEEYKAPRLFNPIGSVAPSSMSQPTPIAVETKFFKNNLVLLASVSPSAPARLSAYGSETTFSKALGVLESNDEVMSMLALSSNGESARTIAITLDGKQFVPTGQWLLPTYLAYNGDTLVAVAPDGSVYYKSGLSVLAALPASVKLTVSPAKIGSGSVVSPATYGASSSTVIGVDWDDDRKKWVFTFDLKNGQDLITQFYESEDLISFNSAFSESEVTALPADFDITKYGESEVIRASTALTLPEGVDPVDWIAHPINPADAMDNAIAKRSFYVVNNATQDKVLVRGKYVFLYTKTKKTDGTMTSDRYWKMATIDRSCNVTKTWITQQGDNDSRYSRAVTSLTDMRALVDARNTEIAASSESSAELKATIAGMLTALNELNIATYANFCSAMNTSGVYSATSKALMIDIPLGIADVNLAKMAGKTVVSLGGCPAGCTSRPFQYLKAEYVPVGSPNGEADLQDAYLDYLSDMLYFLLGDEHTQDLVTGYVDTVLLTDDYLVLKTTYDTVTRFPMSSSHSVADIEDPDNWEVPTLPGGSTIYGTSSSQSNIYAIGTSGTLLVIAVDQSDETKKFFTMDAVSTGSGNMVLGGYFRKKSEIVDFEGTYTPGESDLAARKNYIPAYNGAADVNYPCILYAKGSGSFEAARVNSSVSNPGTYVLATAFAGLRVTNITFESGEFRAFLADFAGKAYGYYLRASADDPSTWDWVKPSSTAVLDKFSGAGAIKFRDESEIPSTVVFNPVSTSTSGIQTLAGAKEFSLTSAKALLGDGVKVSRVTDSEIILDQPIVQQGTGHEVTVLLAIKTRKPIVNQAEYLDASHVTECFTSKGKLKVTGVSETPASNMADRVYLFRELLSTKDHSEKVLVSRVNADGSVSQVVTLREFTAQINDDAYPIGYPALAEDSDRTFYDYVEYVDANNALAYSAKGMTNSEGNPVYLCDDSGQLLINREVQSMDAKCVSAYDEISSQLDPTSTGMQASVTKYTSLKDALKQGLSIKDPGLTSELAKVVLSISALSNDVRDPYIVIKSSASLTGAVGGLLYPYDPDSITKYVADRGLKDIVTNVYDANGNITSSTTVSVASQYENKNGYIWDSVNARFWLSKRVSLLATVSVPYVFYGENVKAMYNPSVKTDETGKLTLNDSMSGIYLNPLGYGGFSTNTDVNFKTLPWDNDPEAFLDVELENSYGEPVYLLTKYGQKVYNDAGTMFLSPNVDYVTVSEKDMDYAKRAVVATQAAGSSSVAVVKPEDSGYVLVVTNEMAPANRDSTSGTIVFPETTEGQAILYKGSEPVTQGVSWSIDYGDFTQLKLSIDTDGNYVLDHWNDSQDNSSEEATVTIRAMVGGKAVASATVTYIEFLTSPDSEVVDLFPSSTSDESASSGMLTRAIRYNDDGSVRDNIVEVTIPEVNTYTFSNFKQLADPVTTSNGGEHFLTFKLAPPDTYSESPCSIYLEDGLRKDRITFRPLIDSAYALYSTCDSLDFVAGSAEAITCFRVFKGKTNVTGLAAVTAVTNSGLKAKLVLNVDYYQVSLTAAQVAKGPASVILTAKVGTKTITQTLPIRTVSATVPRVKFINDNNVVSSGVNVKFTVVSSDPSDVTVKGLYSPVICKAPKYINFKSLLQNEGQVIQSMSAARVPANSPIILSLDTASPTNTFTLSERLLTANSDFNDRINDGKDHVLEFNWLTRSTISQDPSAMNDPRGYTKLALSQIDKYTPDRVYFPADGYPQPAVTVNNMIYNSNNNYMYEADYWFNDNQKRVYECDKDGKYIVYGVSNGALVKTAFNHRAHFSSTKDLRFNPHKPVYTSCRDWYKSKFYLEKNESNPYWQVIKFADTFNVDTRDFDQVVSIYSYEKGTSEMKLAEVSSGERFLNIAKAVTASLNNNELAVTKSAEYIDHKNGKLQFILQQPDDVYRTSQQFVKFGIWASNPFYGNKIFTNNDAIIKLRSMLTMSYIANSTENPSNPLDKDADIVQVSELGIFDVNHSLIAYATFPPIEYHSKTQHVSFVCYIKDGTCSSL